MQRFNTIITIIVISILLVLLAGYVYIYFENRQAKQDIRNDLLAVGAKLELFKKDQGSYPSKEELLTTFSNDPRYAVAANGDADNYAAGLAATSNFFYCKKDNPAEYILLAQGRSGYSAYVTNNTQIKEYDYEGIAPQDRPSDYPFHLHATAKGDVCPKFLPGFSESSNGYGNRGSAGSDWAPWTGVR